LYNSHFAVFNNVLSALQIPFQHHFSVYIKLCMPQRRIREAGHVFLAQVAKPKAGTK